MKSVKEINDFREKYRNMPISVYGIQDLHQFIFETLIGITERIEAQSTSWTENAITGEIVSMRKTTREDIERDAMIRALEWECKECGPGPCSKDGVCRIHLAIARLRNGGDLNA